MVTSGFHKVMCGPLRVLCKRGDLPIRHHEKAEKSLLKSFTELLPDRYIVPSPTKVLERRWAHYTVRLRSEDQFFMSSETITKVLMVDDDPHIRLITEMSLEGLTTWQVRLAGSGSEALRLVQEDRPDLVLLDMQMPGMDGTTVLSEMKKLMGTTMPHVIFMTAKVQSQEMDGYKGLGVAGVIPKPFDPMTLPDQILGILEQGE